MTIIMTYIYDNNNISNKDQLDLSLSNVKSND